MVDFLKQFGAKVGVIQSIAEDSCASLRPSLIGLAESFLACLNQSGNEVFGAGSIGSQLHVNTAIDDITLRFQKGAASDDCLGFSKVEEVVDPSAHLEIIEL